MTRILARGGVRIFGVALLLIALAIPRGVSAAAMSYDGAMDVTAALDEAGRTWDLSREDAVFLLESARFTWLKDGRLREERHRLLWISTDWAQETYADFRLPWDSDRQTLNVKALRVLRDGRWIEARPTAIVDTTPFALRNAPDYSAIRETMLLYDGIELPCVLECAYVIEDKVPFRAGFEGVWTFRHADPALESRLILEAPAEASLRSAPFDGAPEGARTSESGLATATYMMKRLDAAPDHAGEDPAADLPHVTWSTFRTWPDLGRSITASFTKRLELSRALGDSLPVLLDGAPNAFVRAQRIADFVRDRERHIDYDPSFLSAWARPAARVFDTGYGGDLDLAILAGALFSAVGFTVEPAFVGKGPGSIDEGLPTLARMGTPALWVSQGDSDTAYTALWDPASGRLIHEGVGVAGRALWRAATDEVPAVRKDFPESVTYLDLRWDAEKVVWTGIAWFEARGAANPYNDIVEGQGATKKAVVKALNEVMEGLEPVSIDPVRVGPERFAVRAEVTSGAVKRDPQGRVAIVFGPSAGGITGSLPHDVDLQEEHRSMPVRGVSGRHHVRVRIDLGGLEIVRLPEPVVTRNVAGLCRTDTTRGEGSLVYQQTLHIPPVTFPVDQWPSLRALLLAERDPARRTVLLR